VQYFFGRGQGRFPGDTAEPASAQVVPVYSRSPGDPCYDAASMYYSRCTEVYRWNLDYVVDRGGT
jgi:hypothetical protein